MKVIIVTGGIATGKSFFRIEAQKLVEGGGVETFDCDEAAHELLTKVETGETVSQRFGDQVLDSSGLVDRNQLRKVVLADTSKRRELEQILHPMILEKARESLEKVKSDPEIARSIKVFLLEVPLFFDVDFPIQHDLTVAVAASEETQIERLKQNRKLDDETVGQFLNSQIPVIEKVDRADHVIWNDGSKRSTLFQMSLFFNWLNQQQ